MDTLSKFVVGRSYATRSVCDYNTIITINILRRTAKTVRAVTAFGEKTLRISEYCNEETVRPWGSYSMCPIVGATDPESIT